jgi:hypothetical protein
MQTDELLQILHADKHCGKVFHGVFARDEFLAKYRSLELSVARTGIPAAVIVNNADSTHPGEHWVAYFISPENLEFFDSFGLTAQQYGLPRPSRRSRRVVMQSRASEHCGLYATLYLLLRSRGFDCLFNFPKAPAWYHGSGDMRRLRNDCIATRTLLTLLSR